MPVYDHKIEYTVTYSWGVLDMGAGNITKRIPCPKGKRPHIRGVSGHVTETFTETTTPGIIEIGTAADPDAYFDVPDMGVTAANATLDSSDTDTIFAKALLNPLGEKDTDVLLTLTSPTGGTPAGMIELFVPITWV